MKKVSFCVSLILAMSISSLQADQARKQCALKHQDQDYGAFTMSLPLLDNDDDYVYLGSPQRIGEELSFDDFKDTVLIFYIFSMYCMHCQNCAPAVNSLKEMIHEQNLDGMIKIIGIGNKNSEFETKVFREKFAATYPMIPDKERILSKQLIKKPIGTPFFVVVYIDDTGTGYVIHTRSLDLPDPAKFLNTINEKLNIQEAKNV